MDNARHKKLGFRDRVLSGLKKTPPGSFGFRMLPMIDVLFLLLIFFILTARFRQQESFLPFELPGSAAQAAGIKPDPLPITLTPIATGITVQIGNSAGIDVDDKSMDENLAAVVEKLDAILKAQKRTAADPIELKCDRRIKWQYIARVYNLLIGMKISDVTFQMAD